MSQDTIWLVDSSDTDVVITETLLGQPKDKTTETVCLR